MHFRVKMCVSMLAIAALLGLAGIPARAQDKQHVVSLSDLNKDAARPTQTRQTNEETVRTLLSSDQAQKALKSANLDYQKVDKAVGQLSDEDLAKLAERSRRAQSDFAAGRISDRDLLWIILIAIGIIVLVVALR
jgi:Flp pilus assembly protein TadB